MLIPVATGYHALVDDDDFERLMRWSWCSSKPRGSATIYARRNERFGPRCLDQKSSVWMHREILVVPDDVMVDHVNSNGLDNQRHNLRQADNSLNGRNRRPIPHKTSQYKGVDWHGEMRKYRARITVSKGKTVVVGYSADEAVAARLYNAAAIEHFGAFARLNEGV